MVEPGTTATAGITCRALPIAPDAFDAGAPVGPLPDALTDPVA